MLELLTFIISILTFLLIFVYTFFIAVIILNKVEKKQFFLKSNKSSSTPLETKEDKYEYFEKVLKGEIEEL